MGRERGETWRREIKRIIECLKIKKITILPTKRNSGLPSGGTIKNNTKLIIIKVEVRVISGGTVGVPGTPILLNLRRSYNHIC